MSRVRLWWLVSLSLEVFNVVYAWLEGWSSFSKCSTARVPSIQYSLYFFWKKNELFEHYAIWVSQEKGMIYFWISIYLFKVYAGYYSFGHFSFRVDGLTLSDGLNKHFFVIKNVKTSNWKNIRLGLGLNIHVSTLKYIQDRCESNVSENEKTVPYFAKKRTFPNKMAIFQWKNITNTMWPFFTKIRFQMF